MADYLIIHVYVDKNRDMILVPYKECKVGYALATEPYKKIGNAGWSNISVFVLDLLKELIKHPTTEDTETNVMKKICGNKSFKQFSKKHICIEMKYSIRNKKFIISNQPRLMDGSYGVEKDTISEVYSVEYTCTESETLIQENFLKAFKDAEHYLMEIGSKL